MLNLRESEILGNLKRFGKMRTGVALSFRGQKSGTVSGVGCAVQPGIDFCGSSQNQKVVSMMGTFADLSVRMIESGLQVMGSALEISWRSGLRQGIGKPPFNDTP